MVWYRDETTGRGGATQDYDVIFLLTQQENPRKQCMGAPVSWLFQSNQVKTSDGQHIAILSSCRILFDFAANSDKQGCLLLLTLGAHAQRGLWYLVCPSVCLCVCLSQGRRKRGGWGGLGGLGRLTFWPLANNSL